MTLGVGVVVFGVPLVGLPPDVTLSEETDEYKEEGHANRGFIRTEHHLTEDYPVAFGIRRQDLDPKSAFTVLDPARLTITPELRARYTELMDALPEEVQDDLLALGEPHLFILWGHLQG